MASCLGGSLSIAHAEKSRLHDSRRFNLNNSPQPLFSQSSRPKVLQLHVPVLQQVRIHVSPFPSLGHSFIPISRAPIMNGQPIPGYYWDTEKNKYFKIQSQNAARGFDLKYSLDNIRKEERKERIHKAATARSNKIRKERVVRRYPNSFAQTNIEREIGFKRRSFYFNGPWTDAAALRIDSDPKQVISRRPCHGSIRVFDQDPVSKTIYAVQGSNSVNMQRMRTDEDPPVMPTDPSDYYDPQLSNPYAFHPWDEVTRTTSIASSLTYLPATGALAVTSFGSDRPPEVWLSDPERDPPVSHLRTFKAAHPFFVSPMLHQNVQELGTNEPSLSTWARSLRLEIVIRSGVLQLGHPLSRLHPVWQIALLHHTRSTLQSRPLTR